MEEIPSCSFIWPCSLIRHLRVLEHIHKKLKTNQTKIKGSRQSGRKVVIHDPKSDLPLVMWTYHVKKNQYVLIFYIRYIQQLVLTIWEKTFSWARKSRLNLLTACRAYKSRARISYLHNASRRFPYPMAYSNPKII